MLPFISPMFSKPFGAELDGFPDAALVYRTGSNYTGLTPTWTDAVYDPNGWFDSGVNPDRLTADASGIYRAMMGWAASSAINNKDIFQSNSYTAAGAIKSGRGFSTQSGVAACTLPSTWASGDYAIAVANVSKTWEANNATWHYLERLPAATKICSVYNTNNPTVDNTFPALPYNAEFQKDAGFLHSNTVNPSRITIDTGGPSVVRASAAAHWGDPTESGLITIWKNGVQLIGGGLCQTAEEGAGNKFMSVLSPPINVVAGDYLEIRGFSRNAANMKVSDVSWFSVESVETASYTNHTWVTVKKTSRQALTGLFAQVSWDAAEYDPDSLWDAGTPTQIAVPSDVNYARFFITLSGDAGGEITSSIAGSVAPASGLPVAAQKGLVGSEFPGSFSGWLPVTPGGSVELQAKGLSQGVNSGSWYAVEFAKF